MAKETSGSFWCTNLLSDNFKMLCSNPFSNPRTQINQENNCLWFFIYAHTYEQVNEKCTLFGSRLKISGWQTVNRLSLSSQQKLQQVYSPFKVFSSPTRNVFSSAVSMLTK